MKIEGLIKSIRESQPLSEYAYKNGSCFKFFKILKNAFPEAEPYYNGDHVITKIEGEYYDVTGKVEIDSHLKMTKSEQDNAQSWNVDYKEKLQEMLNKETISKLSEVLGLTAEDLTAKITSDKDESLELPEGEFFSEEQIKKRDSGKYNEGKTAGEEMLIKDLKKKYEYDIDGKDAESFFSHHNEELKKKYSKDSTEKVKDLETDISKMKEAYEREIGVLKETNGQLEGKYKKQSLKNTLLSIMPKETALKPEAIITLWNAEHKIEEEDGKQFIVRDGVRLKDDKTTEPLELKSVFTDWLVKENYSKGTQGRGNGSEFGQSSLSNINSVSKFQESWQKNNPDLNISNPKYGEDYAKWRSEVKEVVA